MKINKLKSALSVTEPLPDCIQLNSVDPVISQFIQWSKTSLPELKVLRETIGLKWSDPLELIACIRVLEYLIVKKANRKL